MATGDTTSPNGLLPCANSTGSGGDAVFRFRLIIGAIVAAVVVVVLAIVIIIAVAASSSSSSGTSSPIDFKANDTSRLNVTKWQPGVFSIPGDLILSANEANGSVTLGSNAVSTHSQLNTVGTVFVADGYGIYRVTSVSGMCETVLSKYGF